VAVERRNPIPPGRYWIDTFGPDILDFEAWAMQSPQVEVEASEIFESETPKRQWVLFKVKSPAVFEARKYGFPTIADDNIRTSGDTVQRPDPEVTPGIPELLDGIKTVAMIAAAGIGLGLFLKIVRK